MAPADSDPAFDGSGRMIPATLQAALVLSTAAVCFYLLWYRGGIYKRLWRSFLTFAYLAFLVHLGSAVFHFFQGNIHDVYHARGPLPHPIPDTFLAIWWGIEVIRAWGPDPEEASGIITFERGLFHGILSLAFFLATRQETASQAGIILGIVCAVLILATFIFWASVRRPVPSPQLS